MSSSDHNAQDRQRQQHIRAAAETALAQRPATPAQGEADAKVLLHELQGQQIELEMQNETLRQAQTRLRANAARYREMFEGSPQPMWVYELASLAFLVVNDAAIDVYGYSRAEFLSMTIRDIRPPEDVARLEAAFQQPDTRRLQHSGQWRHLRKDGSLILVEITSHDLDFDHRPSRLVMANDVTDRERASAALRQHLDALERFNRVAVDRELEMIRLKQQVNALSRQLGQAEPFDLDFIDAPTDFEALYPRLPDEGSA